MAEYFVTTDTQAEAGHIVHEKNCSHVEGASDMRYLGSYGNVQAPFNKANGFYSPVSYCPDCLPQ